MRRPLPLRVFLASPGDVGLERAHAREELRRLQYDALARGWLTVEDVAWDTPGAGVAMLAGMTPQAAIAAGRPRPSECDIVVVILWSRMGTPLPSDYRKPNGDAYLSGTEWEYLDALDGWQRNGKPKILVYRRTAAVPVLISDPQMDEKRRQWARVDTFFAAFLNPDGSIDSGCNTYDSPEDFRQLLRDHLREIVGPLLDAYRGGAGGASAEPAAHPRLWSGSPFPGLRAFGPDDAPIFFGRGREADDLVGRLSGGARFSMVVGASGSGKSSLVAAGLIPRLKEGAIEGSPEWLLPDVLPAESPDASKQWAALRFTPGELGDNPFQALAAKLAPLLPERAVTRKVVDDLERDPRRLVLLVEAALARRPPRAEALLFIDQFEELFTIVDKRHRDPFVEMLAAAARAPRLRIVATLRADFYHRCVEQQALTEILRAATYPLAAPGPAALREMITSPAARAGLDFEAGLPDRILDDTGNVPGALALLAFALQELYQRRTRDGRLTQEAYDTFGGVRGAISRRADEAFQDLPDLARAQLAIVFRELVGIDDERGVATRRRASKTFVVSSIEAGQLVDAFIEARLMVTDRGPGGEPMVEVAHETLLREWPRLAEWIGERTDDLRLRRQAEAAAAEWERSDRDASHLWPHERLVPVHASLARLALDRTTLPEPARSFLRPEADRLLEELERPETSHYRRAEIGDRLDRIVDPRPGVGLRPDGVPNIVWCEVPAGTITLEGFEGRFEVGAFLVAKYPVTYRQYRAFVEDPGGYRDQRWWEGLEREPEPGEQYRPTGNCPAEHVSWYDAMACCRWLSARLGYEVRLPTEPEWQRAATDGRSENEYPWGAWADGKANTWESRLSRATAVGVYPDGASPQGALDLAGNVAEWCLTDPNRPGETRRTLVEPSSRSRRTRPDAERHEEVRRVVRGGAWYWARDYARCAYRYYSHPGYRGLNVGFRMVRGSPMGNRGRRRDARSMPSTTRCRTLAAPSAPAHSGRRQDGRT